MTSHVLAGKYWFPNWNSDCVWKRLDNIVLPRLFLQGRA
eukprot:CAMPEP_0173390944 /NCGR_PEP_ID=MMETSP1356-20130122/16671_1 /TAXON_ID=77927 ORGANISM="Hemiselmis virescens, Strain PCC157" /NCGR_SAMPLE_ID=MMETSP1356 /ASSEMBLY_ACC=CAM_ASM_000847 /LENGTH=38 /DNA_ID= /DNA_START= /DNA_END= /DNA_ORIENTATION=